MLILVNLRVLKLQLTGQPKAAEVYNDICGQLDALTAEQSVYQGLWDQQVANTAELGYADSVLGAEMSKVNRRVLVEVSGDRGDARYVAIFPQNPSEAMKGAPDDAQAAYVQGVLAAIAADVDMAAAVSTTELRLAAEVVEALRPGERGARSAQGQEARGRRRPQPRQAAPAHAVQQQQAAGGELLLSPGQEREDADGGVRRGAPPRRRQDDR
ncbi:hypothetical protein L6R49_26145 [Myxococcota bacterium]|nr:hypothetical protein [Myxococcota bacterium]